MGEQPSAGPQAPFLVQADCAVRAVMTSAARAALFGQLEVLLPFVWQQVWWHTLTPFGLSAAQVSSGPQVYHTDFPRPPVVVLLGAKQGTANAGSCLLCHTHIVKACFSGAGGGWRLFPTPCPRRAWARTPRRNLPNSSEYAGFLFAKEPDEFVGEALLPVCPFPGPACIATSLSFALTVQPCFPTQLSHCICLPAFLLAMSAKPTLVLGE